MDLLKLEKEAIDAEVELDDFYCDAWYTNVDVLLHREEEFGQIQDLQERLEKLEKQFVKHDHKDKEVLVRVS